MTTKRLFHDVQVAPGSYLNTKMVISESYSSRDITMPVHVRQGASDGPRVFVTAALHGDELNGTGAVRQLLGDLTWTLQSGTLIPHDPTCAERLTDARNCRWRTHRSHRKTGQPPTNDRSQEAIRER